jgi:hypothetical protein
MSDKTGLSPKEEGGKRKKSSRKTRGRFIESDRLFPFDEETLNNPRMKFDRKGKMVFNTTVEPLTNSFDYHPAWYPCPLRDPTDEDIMGDNFEGNRTILRDWLRDSSLPIWRPENWVQDEATGYPLYLGPEKDGYPIWRPPKKVKRTSKPKRDSLEGPGDLPDGDNVDSSNAKREEQPAVGDPWSDPDNDPDNYLWEFDSQGVPQAAYLLDDVGLNDPINDEEEEDKGDAPKRSTRVPDGDDDSSKASTEVKLSSTSKSSVTSRTKQYRARELEKKRVRDLSDERFKANWDRERAESRERKRERRSRSRDNVRYRDRSRDRSRSRGSSAPPKHARLRLRKL